jgi:redox-sensitive bicupin YhaK (pirin superfamily)
MLRVNNQTIDLTEGLQFDDRGPTMQNLVSDQVGKIVRFSLKAGQTLEERRAPYVPVYLVVVQGKVSVKAKAIDGQSCGVGCLIVFGEHEGYTIQAESDAVLAGFLHWAASG